VQAAVGRLHLRGKGRGGGSAHPLELEVSVEVVVLALLAMSSVCLWTLRVAATTRGHRLLAPPRAAVEAIVYVTAFGRLLADLGSIERMLAFAFGVAAGTSAAMIVADRVSPAGTTRAAASADRSLPATPLRRPRRGPRRRAFRPR
jgi:uncharacterized protein YebE (UPF0316 family)